MVESGKLLSEAFQTLHGSSRKSLAFLQCARYRTRVPKGLSRWDQTEGLSGPTLATGARGQSPGCKPKRESPGALCWSAGHRPRSGSGSPETAAETTLTAPLAPPSTNYAVWDHGAELGQQPSTRRSKPGTHVCARLPVNLETQLALGLAPQQQGQRNPNPSPGARRQDRHSLSRFPLEFADLGATGG